MAIVTPPNITTPTEPYVYQGKQVIINGNRLLFNAKKDDILLYSNTYLGFSTNGSIHFDTGDTSKDCFFVINSPDIYIGLDGNNYPTEPGVLGDKNEEWITKLVTQIKKICEILDSSYSHIGDRGGSTTAKPAFGGVKSALDNLVGILPEIKSKHVYLKT
jgi:hypothetical protein